MSTAMLPPNMSASAHVKGIPNKVICSAGITSIDPELNPSYHSWAHVHIWYCSSDSHLSDITPGGHCCPSDLNTAQPVAGSNSEAGAG